MKIVFKSVLNGILFLCLSSSLFAQNVEEIINSYYETIGGKKWDNVNGFRMTANIEQQGMNIPIEVVSLRDGRSLTKMTMMGNTMVLQAFDGKTSWKTNFMTMQAEENTAEDSENTKRAINEFPSALANFKKLGYTPTLMGTEKIEGTECYKIKLEKKTQLIDGKEVPNVDYYYLDKESKVPVVIETEIKSGELNGKISQTKLSDYQEVEGVYFAFSTAQGLKDGQSQVIQFSKIEINPKVEDDKFNFPKK
jgi:outer membrane lipoprotein-sorting protein